MLTYTGGLRPFANGFRNQLVAIKLIEAVWNSVAGDHDQMSAGYYPMNEQYDE